MNKNSYTFKFNECIAMTKSTICRCIDFQLSFFLKDYSSRTEKIKHQPSRPDAIVWMSKSLIELGKYADARSMISYGEALRKLTKKQRREFYLMDAYYNLRRNDYSPAIEQLENAMLYFKKKKDSLSNRILRLSL